MRFEPANAKYFQVEIASGNSLLNAIQLIGCFSTDPSHSLVEAKVTEPAPEILVDLFRTSFTSDLEVVAQHRQWVKKNHPDLDPLQKTFTNYVLTMLQIFACSSSAVCLMIVIFN